MDIGPIRTHVPELRFPQAESSVLPALPIRAIALGGSGSGKTNMISTLITDPRFYKGRFAKIYWASPTALIDDALQPLREYVSTSLDQNQAEDPTFHDRLDVAFFHRVIERARRVTEWLKSRKPRPRHGFNTLIVIDDLADLRSPAAAQLISTLFLKARHWGISTILSTQKLRLPLVTQAARVNATALFVWRLRNQADLWDGVMYEVSALADKEKIYAAYRAATDKPFGFLYVKLNSQDIDEMFFSGFTSKFHMSDKDEETPA